MNKMKMKTCMMTLAGIVLAMSASAQNFVMKGKVKGNVDGCSVMLQKYGLEGVTNLDSVTIKNGEFTLKGVVNQPEQYQMVIDMNKPGTAEPDYQKIFSTRVYVENKPMTYDVDLTGFPAERDMSMIEPVVKGSTTQDVYQAYLELMSPIQDKMHKMDDSINQTTDLAQRVSLAKEAIKLQEEMRHQTSLFIQQHTTSLVAFDLLLESFSSLPTPYTSQQIDEMMGWLKNDWSSSAQYPMLQMQAEMAKHTAIGNYYIDGTVVTPEGKQVKLSSLIKKGEYTMLEFWASWCRPCRQEIPHLKKVHEKYKDFNIISISVDERDADWKKAMAKEGMTWTQVRNPEGFGGMVMGEYGINGIPACLILDKDGNFYKTNMRGAYLDAFLFDYYKK